MSPRLIAYGLAGLLVALAVWGAYSWAYARGYAAAEAKCAEEREDANREKTKREEKVRTVVREVFINTADASAAREAARAAVQSEIDRYASQNADEPASCLDVDGVRVFNRASGGSPDDRSTTPGADARVPPGTPPARRDEGSERAGRAP